MSLATLPRSKTRTVPPPLRKKEPAAPPDGRQMHAILSAAADDLRERINANAEARSKAEIERKRLALLCAINPRRFEHPLRLADKALRDAEHERDLLTLQEKELAAVADRLNAAMTATAPATRYVRKHDSATGISSVVPEDAPAIDRAGPAIEYLWRRIGEAVK